MTDDFYSHDRTRERIHYEWQSAIVVAAIVLAVAALACVAIISGSGR